MKTTAFPSPCGVKKLKPVLNPSTGESVVSVPLRGKKIETNTFAFRDYIKVSVPLRGKKIETFGQYNLFQFAKSFRPLAG